MVLISLSWASVAAESIHQNSQSRNDVTKQPDNLYNKKFTLVDQTIWLFLQQCFPPSDASLSAQTHPHHYFSQLSRFLTGIVWTCVSSSLFWQNHSCELRSQGPRRHQEHVGGWRKETVPGSAGGTSTRVSRQSWSDPVRARVVQ